MVEERGYCGRINCKHFAALLDLLLAPHLTGLATHLITSYEGIGVALLYSCSLSCKP